MFRKTLAVLALCGTAHGANVEFGVSEITPSSVAITVASDMDLPDVTAVGLHMQVSNFVGVESITVEVPTALAGELLPDASEPRLDTYPITLLDGDTFFLQLGPQVGQRIDLGKGASKIAKLKFSELPPGHSFDLGFIAGNQLFTPTTLLYGGAAFSQANGNWGEPVPVSEASAGLMAVMACVGALGWRRRVTSG